MCDLPPGLTAMQAHLLILLGGEEVPTPIQMAAVWSFHHYGEEHRRPGIREEVLQAMAELPLWCDRCQTCRAKVMATRHLQSAEGRRAFEQTLQEIQEDDQAPPTPSPPPIRRGRRRPWRAPFL